MKPGRHDAHDRIRLAALTIERPTSEEVPVEAPAPETLAEHDHPVPRWFLVDRQHTPGERLHTQERQQVGSDRGAGYLFGSASTQRDSCRPVAAPPTPRMSGTAPPVEERAGRHTGLRRPEGREVFEHHREPIGIQRKRPNDCLVQRAEERGAGANAKREDANRYGKTRRLTE